MSKMNERIKYPIGVQSFSEIINGNYVYVDKTEYVYHLVEEGKYYFLSRPRRFGKSLFLSTLEAFFLGNRGLFKGLAIDTHESIDWIKHSLLHLDFNAKDYTRDDLSLYNHIDGYLTKWEAEYGVEPRIRDLDTRFADVITAANQKTGRQVVILIDEYDRPLLQNLSKERQPRQALFRDMLKGFFGVLKSCDQYIRFAFLTGITKFGRVSVFSDLNNLEDITLDSKYNGICGITESELSDNLKSGIENLAKANDLSFGETCSRLKLSYDGYRFSFRKNEGIYNPFSVLNVLKKEEFGDYWFQTATPTMLVELLRDCDTDLTQLDGAARGENELMGLDPVLSDPIPVLFQSGYLTIKDTMMVGRKKMYRLGFPNEEVEDGFLEALLPFYVNRKTVSDGTELSSRCIEALRVADVDGFMLILKSLLAGVPYSESGKSSKRIHEGRFRDVLFIICRLMGLTVHCELHTALGRIDMIVETDSYVYVMEFKVDKSPEEALAQIEDRHYADRYLADSRTVVKVGVEFSTRERNISAWAVSDIS